MEEQSMIPVKLARLVLREGQSQQSVFLNEVDGSRGFPIVIGTGEAHEIRRVLSSEAPPRPMTHQLTYDAIQQLGADVKRVDIVDLKENTFFARIIVKNGSDQELILDARPSDAMALALRAGCEIRVAESVLDQVRSDAEGPDPLPEDLSEPDEDLREPDAEEQDPES